MTDERLDRFRAFVGAAEPRLRRSLVAAYGPADGRQAAVDALAWAWEHWDRVEAMDRPVAYLYRVGQSAVRRFAARPLPGGAFADDASGVAAGGSGSGEPDVVPELMPALGRLSEAQRTAVVLVHGYGYTQRDVAEMLGVTPSTLHVNLERGLARLRSQLEASDD